MFELENLCEFVLQSNDMYDFNIRFNFLLSMSVNYFEDYIEKNNHLPFISHIFIDDLNEKINNVISRINREIIFEDGELSQNIFLLIIQEDFPEYFKNYCYQTNYINN
jgi:hypothetical protein